LDRLATGDDPLGSSSISACLAHAVKRLRAVIRRLNRVLHRKVTVKSASTLSVAEGRARQALAEVKQAQHAVLSGDVVDAHASLDSGGTLVGRTVRQITAELPSR
jgi:hypothetical protein